MVVLAVLAAATSGCCAGVDDEVYDEDFSGVVEGEVLDEIRMGNATDDERCDAACLELTGDSLATRDDVRTCTATVDGSDAPWDAEHDAVQIECRIRFVQAEFCTGRRPQGHREATLEAVDRGTWFAVHAHLEAASVAAFEELADWLVHYGAPVALVARCRAAAADEVVHARLMTELASRHGADIPGGVADPGDDALLTVALHNAVEGCVHESFAALIAAHQAARADVELGRHAFEILARDELRHGQLAWDLHAWLLAQLTPEERIQVERAQAAAFAELPERAAANAHQTPAGLGWPDAERAATMARMFAEQLRAA
ncbi:MAG: ferritin-like domain-containing protein [Deltaproteobacteria bacterium]|nr:ferritin-like domain-containing protein [Nannocystaceae bacterium]